MTWSDPTQCSDWYVSGDGRSWEFSCIWGAWDDDFWIEAYYWNEDDQLSHLLRYCRGSGYWPSFCCSVSPQGEHARRDRTALAVAGAAADQPRDQRQGGLSTVWADLAMERVDGTWKPAERRKTDRRDGDAPCDGDR